MNPVSSTSITAPGSPGAEPRWSRSAKDGIGTAYNTSCRLWFTLAQGIVTELYYPTVDTPNTRDLQFLISDGETFCHEEKNDLRHEVEIAAQDALVYRQINTDPAGRYRLVKHVLADPHASVLLIHTRVEIFDESLRGKLRLYALVTPHLGGRGAENRADWLDVGDRTLLHAERKNVHLVLGCDRCFTKRSVGCVGVSDGSQDLHKGNFRMDWEYTQAGPGNVALVGEIDLEGAEAAAEFVMGLALADSAVAAAAALLQSLATSFEKHRDSNVAQWQRAAIPAERIRASAKHTGDGGVIFGLSHRVLLAHEDKKFPGAIVASVSIPWGESKGDGDVGGYHLVWTRDLVQSATALLAAGETATPLRTLFWLMCIQKADGSFPQNSGTDGRPYWQGVQLDQMAAPLLLGWRLWKAVPEEFERAHFRPVLESALGYLMAAGPVTAQDRWEENAGYSPSTLATVIAALCVGAELGLAHGRGDASDFILAYADWLNSHIEDWCVTTAGEVLPGTPRHYVRITPADPLMPDPHPDPNALDVTLANSAGTHPARNIVAGDFLHLVRLGIRPADDPIIRDSLAVNDAVLKRDLPGGPGWRRYSFDGYGQKPDGSVYDGTGEGRCWPILTGERGHYELAAGRDSLPYIRAMEQFANTTGLLPEQVWDADDIAERHQLRGRPSGSAMPLCWSHAEYLSLVRSRRDGKVFDRIEPAFQRYAVSGKRDSACEMWTLRHRTRRIPAGRTLRLILKSPATVHWTTDGWATTGKTDTHPAPMRGLHFIDLPTADLHPGGRAEWTFFWRDANEWEGGQNFFADLV